MIFTWSIYNLTHVYLIIYNFTQMVERIYQTKISQFQFNAHDFLANNPRTKLLFHKDFVTNIMLIVL